MILVILYLLIMAVCATVLCTGWGMYVDSDFITPVFAAAFWPVGFPLCMGFLVAMYFIRRF